MSHNQFRGTFQALQDEFHTKMTSFADHYRLHVLIPLCREHRMEFVQGMGVWFFGPADREDIPRHALQQYTFSSLDDIDIIENRSREWLEDAEEDGEDPPWTVTHFLDLSAFREAVMFLSEEYERGQELGFLVDDIRVKDY